MNLFKVNHVILLAGGAIGSYLLLRRHLRFQSVSVYQALNDPTSFIPKTQGVRLHQVYPSPTSESTTDIDIIAIHGLDTDSSHTWKWKDPNNPKTPQVNWLKDPDMLPAQFPTARIFTCDWPASLARESSTMELTIKELARSLLLGIQSRPGPVTDRPILFIASCLGGIILIQAIVVAAQPESGYTCLWRTTAGVVFLATPFRGTAFQDVATLAVPFLRVYASLGDKVVTDLLSSVEAPTPFLQDLVGEFTQIYQQRDQPCQLAIFYETKKGNLLGKALHNRWLADLLKEPKLLVDASSARLDIVPNPIALERTHVEMNKFKNSDDPGFKDVVGQIEIILCGIHTGRPIDKADLLIRNGRYAMRNLKIERLSGDLLSMDQCYINLAIVEQRRENAKLSNEGGTEPRSSPVSLFARLKIENPGVNIEVTMSTLFKPRKAPDSTIIQPRRILIRGRAGVGKTTLCKKIIHDFKYSEMWHDLFERLLWVPLRNLKLKERRQLSPYNFGHLFHDEYFSQQSDGDTLAKVLWHTYKGNKTKTLFILDGLDEVSQDLDGAMLEFLQELLSQPNVIITSRPHAALSVGPHLPDLELETIGFYPDQVKAYVEKAFMDPETDNPNSEKVGKVQSFLQRHQLLQGLVRIPIQLDALCYTWDSFGSESVPETMTAIYRAIEENLWKKDVTRLEKSYNGQPLTRSHVDDASMDEIEGLLESEIYLLGGLAFTGLHHDVIDFEPKTWEVVSKQFKGDSPIFFQKTLTRLSFLRTSEPSSKDSNRTYHFLHLTYQEYFAARYFVRQLTAQHELKCLDLKSGEIEKIKPDVYLGRHKYNARYDIFWRFVTGLLHAEREVHTLRFFQAIEEEPRDLLGPTHQRLVMHCLSEVIPRKISTFAPFRTKLEEQLSQWLLFECNLLNRSTFVREKEFPQQALRLALQRASEDVRIQLLESLGLLQIVPLGIIDLAVSWLGYTIPRELRLAVFRLLQNPYVDISDRILQTIVAGLEDQHRKVREAAVDALRGQTSLSDEILKAIAARLKHQDWEVREVAVRALGRQASLSDEILKAVAVRLEDPNLSVKEAAVDALQGQASLSDEVLKAIAAGLKHQDWEVKEAVFRALRGQASLSDEILIAIVAGLKDQYRKGKEAVVHVLRVEASLSDGRVQASLSDETSIAVVAELKDQNRIVKAAAVDALRGQASLSDEVLKAIAAGLKDRDGKVREMAIRALGGQASLSNEILKAIAAGLEDQAWVVRSAAFRALGGQASLSDEILKAIAAGLQHQDWVVRSAALRTLGGQASLSGGILKAMAAGLKDQDWGVREAAFKALRDQASLSDEILIAVVAGLEDQSPMVKAAAVDALRGQASLSDEILKAIAAGLQHQDWDVKEAVVNVLQGQASLSGEVLKAIAAGLKDQDWKVREMAIRALGGQASLSDEILKAIAAGLKDQDWGVREAAVNALRGQASLSDEILKAMAAGLEDQYWEVKQAVFNAHRGQASISDEIFKAMAAGLEDQSWGIKEAAVNALQGQASLSDEVLKAIAARLKHQDWEVKGAAFRALGGQASLSAEILKAMLAQLEDPNSNLIQAAVDAIPDQASLSDETLIAVVVGLEDQDWGVREMAVDPLQDQASLSDRILKAIVARLKHQDWEVKQEVFRALGGQAFLSDKMLKAIAVQLKDPNSNLIQAAVDAIPDQASLSDEVLKAIAARHKNQDWKVGDVAVRALGGQASLSGKMLKTIAVGLQHQDWYKTEAAVRALRGQASLSHEMLKAMMVHLKDSNSNLIQAAVRALGGQASLSDEILKAVAARLKYQDWKVREVAVKALGGQASLSDEILIAIAARLEDQYPQVKEAAVDVLRGQASLSDEILKAIVVQLNHPDWEVREVAVRALGGQASLSDEMLQVIAVRLKDLNLHVKEAAVNVLQAQSALPEDVLRQNFKLLYKVFLDRSFSGHLCWYISNGILNIMVGVREILVGGQPDWLGDGMVRKTQQDLGVPLPHHGTTR